MEVAPIDVDEPIGWQVLDPDGNIVEQGTISFAEMTGELLEMIEGDI